MFPSIFNKVEKRFGESTRGIANLLSIKCKTFVLNLLKARILIKTSLWHAPTGVGPQEPGPIILDGFAHV